MLLALAPVLPADEESPPGIEDDIRALCPEVPWIAGLRPVRRFFEAFLDAHRPLLPATLAPASLPSLNEIDARWMMECRLDRTVPREGASSLHALFQTAEAEIVIRAKVPQLAELKRTSLRVFRARVAGLLCLVRDAGRARPMS